jgi:aconitate hydratase 2/2-methylisocitrate dehydratase
MVGRACGLPEGKGVRPGTYCEPRMTTVGSQDTTGPMTRDELKDLACLGFSRRHGDAVVLPHRGLPEAGGREDAPRAAGLHQQPRRRLAAPGDGVIHSWLNRLLLPDTVGTGGDSHTRFPIGISFPAGSGLVAFAAATGVMPLDMPESVLVRFKGEMQPGITLRDLVHAIPLLRDQAGPADRGQGRQDQHLLRPHPRDRRPAGPEGGTGFRAVRRVGRALRRRLHGEAEQGTDRRVPQQQRHLMKNMIAQGYADKRSLERRIQARKPGWPTRSCSRATRTPSTPP